jgi:predicted DNA-binding ribbon-helix-helix protein
MRDGIYFMNVIEVVKKMKDVNMKSAVLKRSIVIGGHKTSVSLEDAFWARLKVIAAQRRQTISQVIAGIDSARDHSNLSSAIRLFVLDHCPLQPSLPADVAPHVAHDGFAGVAAQAMASSPND